MDVKIIIWIIYLLCGILVTHIDWKYYLKNEYVKTLEIYGEADDGMLIIYWLIEILCWPIFIIHLIRRL